MSSDHPAADSLQLAQQYLLGELSPEETARFESRLAEEEELPLALADAVLIHDALSGGVSTRSVPGTSPQTRHRIKRFWWGAAAAAVVGVAALVRQDPKPALVNVDRPEVYEALFSNPEEAETPELAEVDADAADELDVPDWMVAAVEAANQGVDDSGRPQEEEL